MKVNVILSMLSLSLLSTAILLTACKKNEDDPVIPPSIMLVSEAGYISTDISVAAGENIKVKVSMQKGDLNMTNFLIDVYTNDTQTYFDTGMNTDFLVWEGIFIKTLADVEEWKFIVRDSEGNAASTSIMISLDTSTQYPSLIHYSPVDFGAQANQQLGGCYNLIDSSMYFHGDVALDTSLQAGIDMLCYYDDIDKNTIASSGANIEEGIFPVNPSSWTITNETRYFETSLSVDDFNNAVNDSIIIANYDEGEAKRKAKKLQADNIYTFRTQSGKLGIFKVNSVNGTNEGSINISLKIQP